MPNIFLSPYSIRAYPKYQTEDLFNLREIGEGGMDLVDIVGQLLRDLKSEGAVDDLAQKTLETRHYKTLRSRKGDVDGYHGTFSAGEFGYEGTGRNIRTGKESYRRTVDDSEEYPFYYRFRISPREDRGLFIFERFGSHSIAPVFKSLLLARLRELEPEVTFKMVPLSVADVFDEFLKENRATEIRLIKNTMPDDVARKLRWLRLVDKTKKMPRKIERGTMEMVLRSAKWYRMQGLAKTIRKIRKGELPISGLIEVDFEYDDASITLEGADGRTKRFYLSRQDHYRTFQDITEDVKLYGGHPTFDSIASQAAELERGALPLL